MPVLDLDLPAQFRKIALQQLDLRAEIGEPAAFRLLLEERQPVLELALHLHDPLVRRLDAPPRLVIVEQCCVRGLCAEQHHE